MKKILLLLTTILVGTSVQAQSLWDTSKPDQTFTFGVRAGINFASSTENQATSTKTGAHFGVTADYNIIKSFSVSSGVFFVSKGFKGNFPDPYFVPGSNASSNTASKMTANYIQVPLLASWRIEAPSGVQFHVNIGPYYAYGISGKTDYQYYDRNNIYRWDNQDTFGDKGFWKHQDIGLSGSVNVLIGHFTAGIGYEYGFSDVAKVFGKFNTRNANMTIGYNF